MTESEIQLLLYHSMMLIVTCDGDASEEEMALVGVFCKTVPELRAVDPQRLHTTWKKFESTYDDRWAALSFLIDLDDDRLCRKAFVLACDIAMAEGGIGGEEYEMLNDVAAALGIEDNQALKVINVLEQKYA